MTAKTVRPMLVAVTLLLGTAAVSACLNDYELKYSTTDLDGKQRPIVMQRDAEMSPWDAFAKRFRNVPDRKWLISERDKRTQWQTQEIKVRNDLAVLHVRLGEPRTALDILNDIEATSPGQYFTAANLGVVHELDGDLNKALFWVKTGITRSPESHRGTEWLHVRILEIRLQQVNQPNLLKTQSVLGLDFGSEDKPQAPSAEALNAVYPKLTLSTLAVALEHQLTERTSLVPPPNDIVADLFFDLANVMALIGNVEHAVMATKLAREYGPPPRAEFDRREAEFQRIAKFTKYHNDGQPYTTEDLVAEQLRQQEEQR